MRFERVTTPSHPDFIRALALYENSFPLHEQRAMSDQLRVLEHPEYHFDLVLDETGFLGLALYWQHPDWIYIEHLCTVPEKRGQGLGNQILSQLAQPDRRIILEIDPPIDDISIRRQGFYQRAGYQVNDFLYHHPAYRADCPRHRLVILSYTQLLTQREYDEFCRYMNETIMQYAQPKRLST